MEFSVTIDVDSPGPSQTCGEIERPTEALILTEFLKGDFGVSPSSRIFCVRFDSSTLAH